MGTSKQATEAKNTEEEKAQWVRQLKWGWAEASIWTATMLTALENGVKGNSSQIELFSIWKNPREPI